MSRQRLRFHFNFTVAVVALVVTVVDVLTKWWARHTLATHDLHLLGPLRLLLRFNSGVSFSFNQSGPLVTTVVTGVVAFLVVLVGLNARRGLPTVGFGLLIGGGLANLINRVTSTPPRVTDFISFSTFPVFNLADVSVTVGFVLLMIAVLRGEGLVGW